MEVLRKWEKIESLSDASQIFTPRTGYWSNALSYYLDILWPFHVNLYISSGELIQRLELMTSMSLISVRD